MSKLAPEVGDVWIDKDDKYKKYIIISADYRTQTITVIDKHFWKSGFSYEVFIKYYTYLGKSKASIEQLFEVKDEKWINVKELGKEGEDYDLIPSNEFLQCVESEGFINEDGIGVEAIEINGTIFYCNEKPIYPSEVYKEKKLDCDYVVWWNR